MAPNEYARSADVAAQLLVRLDPLARQRALVPTAPCNLGDPDDVRVPDLGLHRTRPTDLYCATAAVAIEVRSPRDETIAFCAARGVDEVWVVDPLARTVRIWQLEPKA